jgi:Type IX secretion system protein PorV
MKKNQVFKIGIYVLMIMTSVTGYGQKDIYLNEGRAISPSLPFLLINNDQQTTGLADAGVGLLQYNNSGFDNPAKTVFNKSDFYGSLNYSNYLGSLVNDMSVASLFMNYKINKNNDVIGLSINNLKGGSILNTDANAVLLDKYNSGEFNIKVNYSKKLTEKLAIGIGMKYISSTLFNNNMVDDIAFNRTQTLATDISVFRGGLIRNFDDKADYRFYGKKGRKYFDWGLSITDIGPKLKYNGDNRYNFMPTNLKGGLSYNMYVQDKQRLSFIAELNKFLVPTPPKIDSEGNIIKGNDMTSKNWIKGMVSSFGDAPDGLSEELKEVIWKLAAEYNIEEKVILRTGFSSEAKMKGNRKNWAIGVGFNIENVGANLSFSVPIGGKYNPLGNTLRFGLTVNLNKKDKLDMNNK